MLHRMLHKKTLVLLVLLYICNIVTFFSILIYKNKEIKGYLRSIKSINPIFIYIYKEKRVRMLHLRLEKIHEKKRK